MEGFPMLKHFQVVRAVLLIAVGSCDWAVAAEPARPARDEVQGTVHMVEAGVGYPTNSGIGIQAERRPGEFTVPKGSQATKLKYSFADPKLDYASTKLRGSNIYSVTEKRFMRELDTAPNFALPPGDYKFVVGGSPGATGKLSFMTVPTTTADPSSDTSSDAIPIPPAATTPTTPFRDDLLGFGFDYPEGWRAVGIERGTYSVRGPDADPAAEAVVTIKIVAKTDAQDSALKHLLNIHGRLVDELNAESTKLGPTKVAGEDAVFAIHSYVATDSRGKRGPFDHVQVVMEHNADIYLVSFVAPHDMFVKQIPLFKQILNSWRY